MRLTQEQQGILAGSRGETMAKVMETPVRYGELYHADAMIPVTGKYNHLVTSFGLKAPTPVYELMDRLIAEGGRLRREVLRRPQAAGQERAQQLFAGRHFQAFHVQQAGFL